MAKKAKKSAVKKTSSKSKTVSRSKTSPKAKAKAVKPSASKTVAAKLQTKITSKAQGAARVIEYKLFTEDSVRGLEDQVNYHIKKGWAPVGGVVLQGNNFTQTMVRHED